MLHRENKIRRYHETSAADLIADVMDYYEITQQDLASRLGVSQKNISDILNRKRYINEVLALRIQKVMGISSKLLLALDSDYKLHLAMRSDDTFKSPKNSPLFLQSFSWANA